MIKEGFLQQMAFDKVDRYCSPEKQVKMMKIYVDFYKECQKALSNGVSLESIRTLPVISQIIRSKYEISDNELEKMDELYKTTMNSITELSGTTTAVCILM